MYYFTFSNFKHLIEAQYGVEVQVAELEFERGKIMRQRDEQLGILQDLQKELDDWNEKVRLTELDKINREHELALLRDETAAKKAECDRYMFFSFLSV